MTLVISDRMLGEMTRHAHEKYPQECCGALAGPMGGRTASEVVCVDNEAADPRRFFEIGAGVLRSMYQSLAQRGLEPVAWYHSHPDGVPAPSRTDLSYMADPRVSYMILALGRQCKPGEVKISSWRINISGLPAEEGVEVSA